MVIEMSARWAEQDAAVERKSRRERLDTSWFSDGGDTEYGSAPRRSRSVLVVGSEHVPRARHAPTGCLFVHDSPLLAAVACRLPGRALRRGDAAKTVEPVIGELLPCRWCLDERESAAVASIYALEAQPTLAKIEPDAVLPGGRIDVPYLPLETIAVSEDP
jgi:hypothetical protein